MKFNCGLTKQEKLVLLHNKRYAYYNYIVNWHDWFAWHPVRISRGDCRWLEWVQRKNHLYAWKGEREWIYRPIPEER